MNYITKTEAFAHHGATLTAPRSVWAKKSDDGKFVVLAAWRKGFNRDPFLPGKASYTFGDGSPNPTPNRGRKEFIELMNELEKVVRVIKKVDASAPHAVLLVLDATVGQNALSQVEAFHRTAGVTGLVMTKLDGTARGGILVALAEKFKLPVHFIGVGEGIDDLAPFTARDFANAIAGIE